MPAPKPRRHPRTGGKPLVLWTALLGALVATPAYTQEWSESEQFALLASGVVGIEVIGALADRDVVDVVVAYASPASARRADSIVAPLSDEEFVLRHRFRRLPALAGTITRASSTSRG